MRNKAIVRVEASEGIEDFVNGPFLRSIFFEKIKANEHEYVVRPIVPSLYLQENYVERIKSATKAYQLVCSATELGDEESINWDAVYISKMKAIRPLTDREAYQETLIEYLQFLEYQLNTKGAQNEPNPLLETKAADWLNKADQYTTLSDKPALVTVTMKDEIIRIQMEIPESPFNDEMLEEMVHAHPDNMNSLERALRDKCPEWYRQMPAYEKALFNQVMRPYTVNTLDAEDKGTKKEMLKSEIKAISSRLRSIPGVANFSRHECLFVRDIDGQYEVANSTSSYRSSAISPRDQLDFDTHADNNMQLMLTSARQQLQQIIQTFKKNIPEANLEIVPILSQTLLSPLRGLDDALYQNKTRAIDTIKDIDGVLLEGDVLAIRPQNLIDTNHPLNAARHISETGREGFFTLWSSQRTQASIESLLTLTDNKLRDMEDSPQLRELTLLRNELNIRWRSVDNSIALDNNREMHLAALEGLIVQNLGGLDHSTCVSGKDRDGLLHIYKDAIKEYFVRNNELPPYDMNDVNRGNFVAIFADIFLTNHQQLNAGQNAPGAGGIKTPERYLPEDMLQAIKDLAIIRERNDPIKESNALANNNDFGKLFKKQPNRIGRHAGWSALAGFFTGLGLSGTGLLVTGGILTLCAIGIEVAFPFIIPIGIGIGCIVLLGTILGGGIGYAVKKKSEENKWEAIAGMAPEVENNFDVEHQGRFLHEQLAVNRNSPVVNLEQHNIVEVRKNSDTRNYSREEREFNSSEQYVI